MKNIKYNNTLFALFLVLIALFLTQCERDVEGLEPAPYSTNGDVFIDGFSAGLNYAAFGGSDVTAFDVDEKVKYKGTSSMRFDIPNEDSPSGSYAGGVYFTNVGRNLSGYTALTFWAKASKSEKIALIGFGNDLGESKYQASLKDVKVSTKWTKYYIPLPDPSKLKAERGMFYYSEGPEEGAGYTFWIDEVKFEKLGTIAHPQPVILETQDQEISAETGDKLNIGGLYTSFNLPTGVDQRVETAHSYFNFISSETSVASVNELGVVSILDSGAVVITATLNEQDALGSLSIQSTGEPILPSTLAPTPTVHPDSVISLFCNEYIDVPVDTWNTHWQYSTAELKEVNVDGDDMKQYKKLNFVGIEFSSQTVDASEMTHFHLDLWTPDPTEAPKTFKIALIDFGADGTFDGGDDSSHEISFTSPTLVTENWVSLDIPISNFSGLTGRANLAQMVFAGEVPNVFIDNIYFYKSDEVVNPTGPTEAAPTPNHSESDVISIYSDSYTNVENTDFYADWGQSTAVSEQQIEGNNTLKYAGLNYQGIVLESSLDVSGMKYLHIDYWTDNSTSFNTFLISSGPTETAKAFAVPTDGWNSIDIPLGDFSPVDLADLIQFKFDGNGDIYLDNIYFYKDGGSNPNEPTTAAPTPTHNGSDVISVFSDAYSNVDGTDFYPGWGQTTVVSEEQIEGNNTLKYAGLNYQGIVLGSSQNVSGMKYLHIDYWTANSTALNTFLISSGPVETARTLAVPTSGWMSLDIPISDFSPVDLNDIIQIKFDGDGDIFIDNIYFYKEGGSSSEWSTFETIDFETSGFGANWGWNVFENDANLPLEFVANPDASGINTSAQVAKILAYQAGQQWAGCETQHGEMGTFNIDASSKMVKIMVYKTEISDVGIKFTKSDGWSMGEIKVANTKVNEWEELTFDFSSQIESGYDQIVVFPDFAARTQDNVIYFDNITFDSDGGGNPTEPTTSAPTPTQSASDVISVFSDAYSNVDGTDFYPSWGQSTIVTEEQIQGNNTLKYASLNYQGIVLGSSLNVAGMDYLHIDYWTANSTALNTFLISSGPVETANALSVPTSGWMSLDISLSDFSPVDLADIIQFKFDGYGDIWLDNIYFYKEGGSSGEWSTAETIDFETSGFGAGWTWSVFENESNPPLEFVANPDPSGENTSPTVVKITAFQAGQPWVGCETVHGDIGSFSFDASNSTVKMMVYKSVISDVAIKFAENNGEAQPEVKVSNTKINEWEELTFDLSGSIGVGITGIIDQIIVFPDFDLNGRTSDNVVYFDNIRFTAN